ncbi:MAG: hypothetical protein WDN08_02240 [Rhizomicrobium sp.]
MTRELVTVFLFLAVVLAIYRYHRRILDALRRFDADNVKRIKEQEAEKADPLAHFKHTLKTAEEQVEAVTEITIADARLGTPVTRYVFEGEQFATRAEADIARAEKIRAIARTYYVELPAALAERKDQSTVAGTAPPNTPPPTGSNVVPLRRGDETLH